MIKKIGFIGIGNMSTAIVGGMLQKGIVKNTQIYASRRDEKALAEIEKRFGIHTTTDNEEVIRQADIIILGMKPQFMEQIIGECKSVDWEGKLVISMSPGKTISWLQNLFEYKAKIVRCMPNTPALVGEGCTAVTYGDEISEVDKKTVETILGSFGMVREVTEKMMDAVVGVSGSAPAYVFLFIEAMADAAVAGGMPRKQAYEFAAQTVLGSAKMVLETGKHPGELKDMVCSPGGTTIEAVKVLEEKGFRGAVIDAISACIDKSKNM